MAKRTDELIAHPVAALFPMLPDDELQELAESIKARGLEHPIVLDKAGLILDGRNRYAACKLAGIEPRFVTFEGDDPDGYALEVNVNRRHMSKGARAMAVAMAHPDPTKHRKAGSSLKNLRIGTASSDQALLSMSRTVLRVTPTIAQSVIAGEKPLAAAYEEAKVIEAERVEFNRKLDLLKASAPDLALRVTDENMDADEAIAAFQLRERKAKDEEAARKAKENADLQKRSVELKNAIDDAANASRDFASAFVADALTIIGGQQAIPQAIEIFGEKIVPAPLFTRDRLAEIEKALALLKKEFSL